MNKEVDLSVSCLGKVKELKYDVIICRWELRNPIIYICRISPIAFSPMILPWRQPNWHLAVRVSVAW